MYAVHERQLGGGSPLHILMGRSDSEAQGRRREARSEGSVEQRREPMDKKRIKRPTASGELACDREAHNHPRALVVDSAAVR